MPPFGCFTCCLGEEGGKTVEVVSTVGQTPGEEAEDTHNHHSHVVQSPTAKAGTAKANTTPAKATNGVQSPASAASGGIENPDDILAKPRKLGPPCRKKMPRVGDIVMSMSGKKVGHDSRGNAKAWILSPGQCAEVMEVDADGDFRLRTINNVESGFLFRKEFAYAIDPDAEAAAARDETKKQDEVQTKYQPFDVVLEHPEGSPIGMRVDTMSPYHLEINEVTDGIVQRYNGSCPPSKVVKEGYFVVGVDGKPCMRDVILAHMKQTGEISLRIAPNEEFSMQIKKNGKVGLVLLVEPLCRSLLVSKVCPGCVEDYNASAAVEVQVKENDRIIEVNGVRGDCNKMLELTRVEGGELKLVISRPVS